MNVEQLIAKLQKLDPNLPVLVRSNDGTIWETDRIIKKQFIKIAPCGQCEIDLLEDHVNEQTGIIIT